MNAKEAYEKAVLNEPKRLEKEAKEQQAVITHIYKLIDLAVDQGRMFFISEPIRALYATGLVKQLRVDGFECKYIETETKELYKIEISWNHEHTIGGI